MRPPGVDTLCRLDGELWHGSLTRPSQSMYCLGNRLRTPSSARAHLLEKSHCRGMLALSQRDVLHRCWLGQIADEPHEVILSALSDHVLYRRNELQVFLVEHVWLSSSCNRSKALSHQVAMLALSCKTLRFHTAAIQMRNFS